MSKASYASYLENIFDRGIFEKRLRQAKKLLANEDFDGLLVRGTSGVVFGSVLAHRLKKRLVVVRKKDDGSHSSNNVENIAKGDKLVFVDDLIASGSTLRQCVIACLSQTEFDCYLVGSLLYGEGSRSTMTFKDRNWTEERSHINIKKQEEKERARAREEEQKRAREALKKDSYWPADMQREKESIWPKDFPTDLTVRVARPRRPSENAYQTLKNRYWTA